MTNPIYASEKVLPYVYMGVHKTTGQFYFGYRAANKLPSHLDLGTRYFTSSKRVKKLGFDSFTWYILAEFFDLETSKRDAFELEQDLILEHWKNPLKLNVHHDKTRSWSTIGISPTEEQRLHHSSLMKGRNKNNNEGVARMARKKLGQTKETCPGVAIMADKLRGRTKDTHKYLEDMAEKQRGRTKETHEGVARTAAKLRGRTKETHDYLAQVSAKKTGQTKETHPKLANRYKGKTKETVPYLRVISEKRTKLTHDQIQLVKHLKDDKLMTFTQIKDHLELLGICIGRSSVKRYYGQSDVDFHSIILTCPHCGKQGRSSGMYRHHFDKCKAISHTEL